MSIVDIVALSTVERSKFQSTPIEVMQTFVRELMDGRKVTLGSRMYPVHFANVRKRTRRSPHNKDMPEVYELYVRIEV